MQSPALKVAPALKIAGVLRFAGMLGAALALAVPAWAQTAKPPPRGVSLFAFLCLRQLPDLDAIHKAAGFGEFAEMTGAELAPYKSGAPGEELRAWRFTEPNGVFVLTAAKSAPDARQKSAAPDLAGATNFACSLTIPPVDSPAAVLKGLTELLGRSPTETQQDGSHFVHVWRERTAKHLSHVHYYPPTDGAGGGKLAASTLLKN